MDKRIGTLCRDGNTVHYITLEGRHIEGDLDFLNFQLDYVDRNSPRNGGEAMDKPTNQQLHAKAVEAYLGKDVATAVAAHVDRIKRVREASKVVLRVSK